MDDNGSDRLTAMNGIDVLPEWRGRKLYWCAFEAPGVEPIYAEKESAASYAIERLHFRPRGIIHILDQNGELERIISYEEAVRLRDEEITRYREREDQRRNR